jgi:hypothetical protein
MNYGNQHQSLKLDLMRALRSARRYLCVAHHARKRGETDLAAHYVADARYSLALYRAKHDAAPASTRRRWACGH